jgi:hypothetical protein
MTNDKLWAYSEQRNHGHGRLWNKALAVAKATTDDHRAERKSHGLLHSDEETTGIVRMTSQLLWSILRHCQ